MGSISPFRSSKWSIFWSPKKCPGHLADPFFTKTKGPCTVPNSIPQASLSYLSLLECTTSSPPINSTQEHHEIMKYACMFVDTSTSSTSVSPSWVSPCQNLAACPGKHPWESPQSLQAPQHQTLWFPALLRSPWARKIGRVAAQKWLKNSFHHGMKASRSSR